MKNAVLGAKTAIYLDSVLYRKTDTTNIYQDEVRLKRLFPAKALSPERMHWHDRSGDPKHSLPNWVSRVHGRKILGL